MVSGSCAGSVWVDRAPCRLCAQRPPAVPAGRGPHNCGDEKGFEVSRGRLFQDLIVQGEIGNRSLQPCVLLFELLEPPRLIKVQSAVLAPPPVVEPALSEVEWVWSVIPISRTAWPTLLPLATATSTYRSLFRIFPGL